ncbi:MAG: YbaB/EbfC family nucleoid-associated protein [Deltaproteobacteria bacterium]|nr:YbaB/EbfC family nucleoid-associated protein [Deltaproteobacteria bacterium]MDL1972976.1 YbaB/EbfC family nucleoid-associated protein [Deltaproteobacteria bacterium]
MMDINQLIKQMRKIQGRVAKLEEELANKTVESSVGGGMVKVVANGKREIVSITIDREVINPDDVEMLQDLIIAATNDALKKAQEMITMEIGKITGGIKIPGLM